MPTLDDGLLARIDALLDLAADRRGLLLDGDKRLAPSEARSLASALGLHPIPGAPAGDPAGEPAPSLRGFGDDAVELLRSLAEAVGILRERAGRLEVTSLYEAWRRIAAQLRAGLVYASWCHRCKWPQLIGGDLAAEALAISRVRVLRLLFALPAEVEVTLAGLADTVADATDLPAGPWLQRSLAAVFLDPLVALGVAQLNPGSPQPPTSLRLSPLAHTVIGSALVAAGDEVPLAPAGAN